MNLYVQTLMEWLNNNFLIARRKINEVRAGLYDDILYDLVGKLSYEEFRKIDGVSLKYLTYLITEAKRGRQYQSEDDKNLVILQTKFRVAGLGLDTKAP